MKFNYTAYTTVYCMKYYLITVSTKLTGLIFRFKLLYTVPLRCNVVLTHDGLSSKYTRTREQVQLYPRPSSLVREPIHPHQ